MADKFGKSENFSGGEANEPMTLRGHDWPSLRQFGVFLENRVGVLHDLFRQIESIDIRVRALSVVDSIDCAIARLIVNDYDRARERFELSGFKIFESDVVGVELSDDPQPYLRICQALIRAELNIHYSYPLLYRRHGRGGIALFVDDVDLACRTLRDSGHRIITENDLLQDDEFF